MTHAPDNAELEVIFDRYLSEVLVLTSQKRDSPLEVPDEPESIAVHDLRQALADPSILLGPSHRSVRQKMDKLLIFALWLRATPSGHIPDELGSRAARFRFALWSLPARVGWPEADELYSDQLRWPGEEIQPIWQATICDEARAAQQEWKRHLDSWEDDPWLAARHADADASLEDDLRWLTTTWPRTRRRKTAHKRWPKRPGILDLGSVTDHSRVAADDVVHAVFSVELGAEVIVFLSNVTLRDGTFDRH